MDWIPFAGGIAGRAISGRELRLRNSPMSGVTIIAIDLAKNVVQIHSAAHDGAVVFRRKISRKHILGFLEEQPKCVVAMEACATAHYWGRQIQRLAYDVRLIASIYVKPFVKRCKNRCG